MPMIPHASIPTPEHYIKRGFQIPTAQGGAGHKSEFRRQMEEMSVSETDALIFDNINNKKVSIVRACATSYAKCIAKKNPEKKYVIRNIKQGVVKTIAVWRVA